jgi:hypothetical protein
MKTTWRLIGLYAVMATALTAASVTAGPEDSDTPKSKDLAEIQRQLDRIVTSLDRLEGIKKDIREVRGDLEFQRTVKIPGLEQEIRDLQQQMVRMTEEMARLRTSPAGGRTSFYTGPGPGPGVAAGPAAASGTIRLHNTYLEPVTIAVNNRTYDVAPGAELLLNNQPAGEFTYEVLGIQRPVRRMLLADRTFSINVFPQ